MGRKRHIPKDTEYFHYCNLNPSDKHVGDCAIRAIAAAVDQTWDNTLEELVKSAFHTKCEPSDRENLDHYLKYHLYWTKCNQPRKFDNTKLTGKEFIDYITRKYPDKDAVIASIGMHHITVFKRFEDGKFKCQDIWDPTDNCIGTYWIKS